MSKRLARKPSDATSAFLRIEELILASSGADVFEETLALIANDGGNSQLPASVREQCTELLMPYRTGDEGSALDALFETLITRTSKGQKGQFFTPRYVVDFCVRLLDLQGGESVLDPACGSGAFLSAALQHGAGSVRGYDIDERAVRIAKLLLKREPSGSVNVQAGDGLREVPDESADAVLSNPPFAGEVCDPALLSRFELAAGRPRIERDVLFLEQCIKALRPGGKLAIVLPHSKFAGKATRSIREWLMERAEILAVIGLGRNTFLPHTHQKANVLLARRRTAPRNGERPHIFFAQSLQDGKNTQGKATGTHDLDTILQRYRKSPAERTTELDGELTLAPERNGIRASRVNGNLRIGALAPLANEYCRPGDAGPFVVLDTTHAADGFISRRPLKRSDALASNKKRLQPGDVIVSRLRPYLRQIAFVDADLFEDFAGAQVCCSTEFYVFRRADGGSAAFFVPYLLSAGVQQRLAQSQEGGHHPRVPSAVVSNICVPAELVAQGEALSMQFLEALALFRDAERARELLVRKSEAPLAIED